MASRFGNIIIQILNLLLAIVPNLLYPALFGLDFHGTFLGLVAAPTFIAQVTSLPFDMLLVKELATRPECGLKDAITSVLAPKALIGAAAILGTSYWFEGADLTLSVILAVSTAMSSFALAGLYAKGEKAVLIRILGIYVAASLVVTAVAFLFNASPAHLTWANVLLNVLMFAMGLWTAQESTVGNCRIELEPLRILLSGAIVSPLVVLSYGTVAIAAAYLSTQALSLLRIGTSIAQAATTFFPIAQRMILQRVATLNAGAEGVAEIERYMRTVLELVALFALLASTAICAVIAAADLNLVAGEAVSLIARNRNALVFLLPAVPLFLLASILEKVVIGALPEQTGAKFGIITAVAMVSIVVATLVNMPGGGFAAYAASASVLTAGFLLATFLRLPRIAGYGALVLIGSAVLMLAVDAAQSSGRSVEAACLSFAAAVAFSAYLALVRREALAHFLRH